MFNKENTIGYILVKIPEYENSWKEHLEYWKGNDNRTIGLDIVSFLDFTTEKIEQKRHDLLPIIFEIIEELVEYGDSEIIYAVKMMFLENLINRVGHNPETMSYETIIPALRSKSKEFCRFLDVFWGNQTPGLWDKNENFIPQIGNDSVLKAKL